MNAVSPFSILDHARPGISAVASSAPVQRIATEVHRAATQSGGLGRAFADVVSNLDINEDGKLNGADAVGHAVSAGTRLLNQVFGIDEATPPAGNPTNGIGPGGAADPTVATTVAAARGTPVPAAFDVAERASADSERELSGLARVDAIRATYGALRAARGFATGPS